MTKSTASSKRSERIYNPSAICDGHVANFHVKQKKGSRIVDKYDAAV
jgi:hypothetical protein